MALSMPENSQFKCTTDKFTNNGEKYEISALVQIDGIKYYIVSYYKKHFNIINKEPVGYIFIDEKGNVVQNKILQARLGKLFYFYDIFYNDESKSNIKNALREQILIERDIRDFKDVISGLDFLSKEGLESAEIVKTYIEKIPKLRELNNIKFQEAIDVIKKCKNENIEFDEEILESVLPIYKEALLYNFDKVKTIAAGTVYYDEIKSTAEKKKKQFSVRFNKKLTTPLMKLTYQIGYFKRVITTYEKVLNMNTNQYSKFLEKVQKDNIEEKLKIIRF